MDTNKFINGQTTNTIPTEIFLQGITNRRIIVPTDKAMFVELSIVARDTVTNDTANYKVSMIAKNVGGTTTVVSDSEVETIYEENVSFAISLHVNDGDDTVRVTVTGSGNIVEWVGELNILTV